MTRRVTIKGPANEVQEFKKVLRSETEDRVHVIRLHRVRVHGGARLSQLRGIQRRHALRAHEVQQQLE